MKIILATGIYPPDIGGPATYVRELAAQMVERGDEVWVVTYGERDWGFGIGDLGFVSRFSFLVTCVLRLTSYVHLTSHISHLTSGQVVCSETTEPWSVFRVAKNSGPLLRWLRYARMLRKVGRDADVFIAFSSVSAGVPLWMSRLKKSRRILRLGGDFLWERYTDRGGRLGLKEFYEGMQNAKCNMQNDERKHQAPSTNDQVTEKNIGHWDLVIGHFLMRHLLRSFDHIVFSTRWQEEIYEKYDSTLPEHSVIENALPEGVPAVHQAHEPFRLLFLGRFVAFKNLLSLLHALADVSDMTLTMVGSGPMEAALRTRVEELALHERVTFLPPQTGDDKHKIFAEHDLLVLPSITEISPNTALEARMAGLPVLLTTETGLSASLSQGMVVRELRTSEQIARALTDARDQYTTLTGEAAKEPFQRDWKAVAQDWRNLLSSLV